MSDFANQLREATITDNRSSSTLQKRLTRLPI